MQLEFNNSRSGVLGVGFQPVQGHDAAKYHNAAGPEAEAGRIVQKHNPDCGGEDHLAGQKNAAFPPPAEKKALIHQQLGHDR